MKYLCVSTTTDDRLLRRQRTAFENQLMVQTHILKAELETSVLKIYQSVFLLAKNESGSKHKIKGNEFFIFYEF
jgi:hypothetical protein